MRLAKVLGLVFALGLAVSSFAAQRVVVAEEFTGTW